MTDREPPLRVLVLQWAVEGRAHELATVEDALTGIAARHAVSVTRERGRPLAGITADRPPDEVHLLTFADRSALDDFLADPDRVTWAARLREVLENSIVVRLEAWG